MPDTADPVAAALAAIGERNGQLRTKYGYVGGLLVLTKAQYDVPRLLALAAVLLEGHAAVPSVRLEPCAEHEHWRGPLVGDNDNLAVRRACPACRVFDDSYCRSCVGDDRRYHNWPCQQYKDACETLGIEAPVGGALLGEEPR